MGPAMGVGGWFGFRDRDRNTQSLSILQAALTAVALQGHQLL